MFVNHGFWASMKNPGLDEFGRIKPYLGLEVFLPSEKPNFNHS
jgi:hypothetical protein